jgi:hypothetical protein
VRVKCPAINVVMVNISMENSKGDEMAGKKKPHDPERREEPYHGKKPKK